MHQPRDSQFRHDSLQNASNEIRLFQCHRSEVFANRPRLMLRTFEIDMAPRYTAISYVWGSSTRSTTIEINERELATTSNAYYALQQVVNQYTKDHLQTSYFWMDSICIDQWNLDEKGKQVALMGDIFRNAIEVLACVGPHASNSHLVMDILKATDISRMVVPSAYAWRQFTEDDGEVWDKLTAVLQERWEDGDDYEGTFIDCRAEFSFSMASFCNRQYWRRIWMVQEIRLAEIVKILCGSTLMDLSCIAPFFTYAVDIERQGRLPGCTDSPLYALVSNSHHTQDNNRREGPWLDAKDAFLHFSDWECTDFRDRVYALLKLLKYKSRSRKHYAAKIKPDYRVSKLGLLVQVAKDIRRVKGISEPFSIIENLYRALRLSTGDAGVRGLLAQRQKVLQQHTIATQQTLESTKWLEWTCRCSFLLDSAPGGFNLRDSPRILASEDMFATENILSYERTTRLYVDGETVGWVSADVRAGDLLIAAPQLIVRSDETLGPDGFRVIGHAALRNQVGARYESKLRPITLKFDIEDLIAFVTLRVEVGWDDLSANHIDTLLNMAPNKFSYSSWAELESKADKIARLRDEEETSFDHYDSRLGQEIDESWLYNQAAEQRYEMEHAEWEAEREAEEISEYEFNRIWERDRHLDEMDRFDQEHIYTEEHAYGGEEEEPWMTADREAEAIWQREYELLMVSDPGQRSLVESNASILAN